jgi:L-erythro-3,5-diaminohexanoate dehydrogenase
MSPIESPYGLHRVIGQHSLPQPADRLDPTLPCGLTEIEIAVEYLHIDASGLRQLRTEHQGDLCSVRTALLTLVKERGKLHNRVTNSGGILIGRSEPSGPTIPIRRRLVRASRRLSV